MVEGNILGTVLVLTIFLVTFNLIVFNFTSEQNSFCDEKYNVTESSNATDTLYKITNCKSSSTHNLQWFVLIVDAPMIAAIILGTKKLVFI
jgi:hypothetical protein